MKKYLVLKLKDGAPTVEEIKGRGIKILGVDCFWYNEGPFFYIIEKRTGLAFSDTCISLLDAKNDARIKLIERDLHKAIERAKREYPHITFPIQ